VSLAFITAVILRLIGIVAIVSMIFLLGRLINRRRKHDPKIHD
jgi:hypothetical protein